MLCRDCGQDALKGYAVEKARLCDGCYEQSLRREALDRHHYSNDTWRQREVAKRQRSLLNKRKRP